jgi:SCP-2 sterol transfer family
MTANDTFFAALQALRTDQPVAYLALLAEMVGLTAQCHIDDEQFGLACTANAITHLPVGPSDLHITASRAALIAMVDGDLSLLAAIRARHLQLTGTTAALAHLARAQRRFAEGAARSRRVQHIFDAFKRPD